MTIEPDLVERVDRAASATGMTRSAFTRMALEEALRRMETRRKEEQHRHAYELLPAEPGELDLDDEAASFGDRWDPA